MVLNSFTKIPCSMLLTADFTTAHVKKLQSPCYLSACAVNIQDFQLRRNLIQNARRTHPSMKLTQSCSKTAFFNHCALSTLLALAVYLRNARFWNSVCCSRRASIGGGSGVAALGGGRDERRRSTVQRGLALHGRGRSGRAGLLAGRWSLCEVEVSVIVAGVLEER